MSGRVEAKKALAMLNKHADVLLDAYFDNRSVIKDIPEHENAIRDLMKYRLVWSIDQHDDVRLGRDLKHILDVATSHYRRRSSHAQIADNWEHLIMLVDQFAEARKRNSTDRQNLLEEIEESAAELIENLRGAVSHFAQFVASGFAFTSDIELRIQENHRVLKMAGTLNDLLDTFDPIELYERPGQIRELNRLFIYHLPRAIAHCNRDLVHSIGQLRQMLTKLKENQHISRLIDAFEQRYLQDHGFTPSIDDLVNFPAALNTAAGLPMCGYADIYDVIQEGRLGELVVDLRDQIDGSTEPLPDAEPLMVDVSEEVAIDSDPLQDAALAVIQVAQEGLQSFSALECYVRMNLDQYSDSPELWMLALANQVEAMPREVRHNIEMRFCEEATGLWPDLLLIHDIIVQGRAHAA
ncbi:hypothetical protein [Marinobacterium sedimentorum]|uniref:hypothetical protein n=1 Tax=Marinobacterium sedimentorum TaxID=2927804 RepID=UPI0020C7341B|nr:hypothetical protein [Marinobacterium sedimentorum]MCP8687144.1 hypothetical protein [Marinobacterium sedimentorum]